MLFISKKHRKDRSQNLPVLICLCSYTSTFWYFTWFVIVITELFFFFFIFWIFVGKPLSAKPVIALELVTWFAFWIVWLVTMLSLAFAVRKFQKDITEISEISEMHIYKLILIKSNNNLLNYSSTNDAM